MSFGHCPPPLKASLASFDDQVIKYLGDRGGPDEHLWTSLQDIDIPKQSQKQDTKYYNGQNRNMHRSISAEIDQNSQCIGQDYSQGAKPQDCSDGSKGVKNQPKSPRSPRYEESIVKVVSLGTETVSATSTQPESAVNALVDATVESTRSLALMYHADLLSALNTSTESSSTTVSTSADSINKLWDRIGQLVQTTSSDTATSSSSTTTSSSSIRLGKRGRYFLDIWDEEEFLSKIKTKTRLHVLQDWSELFHGHYTDNHDGCYRDWLVGKQMDTKARLLDNKFNKKKRPSDPIFWTNVVVPNDTSELAGLVPPPVPVAIQHPASWGIRKATGLDPQSSSSSSGSGSSKGKANSCSRKSVDIDASVVHPASCSQKAIVPVHGKQASSTDGAWSEEEEDVDDFNVYADRLDQQLAIEEASNFIRLSRLQNVLSMHESALKLGAKRRRLEDLVYRAIGKMEPSSSDRVLYAFKPLKSQSSASAQVFSRAGAGEEKPCGGVRKVDIKGNEIPRSLSDSSLASSGHQQTRYCCHPRDYCYPRTSFSHVEPYSEAMFALFCTAMGGTTRGAE